MDEEIRRKILTLLDQHRIMTIATLRPDGWPQATTVGYANEGLTLYFLCGPDSQKAANLARDDRVSLTIDHDTPQVMEITGLSMAARAQAVLDPAEAEKVLRMLLLKYPSRCSLPVPMPTPAEVRIFRVTPTVISVLDTPRASHTPISSPAQMRFLRASGSAIPRRFGHRILVSFIMASVAATLGPIPRGLGTFAAACVGLMPRLWLARGEIAPGMITTSHRIRR